MNTNHVTRRIAVTLLAAVAASAIAVPAQADPPQLEHAALVEATRPDDRASRPPLSAAAVRPDDRAFRGTGQTPPATPAHPDDRAARISPTAVPALPAAADGFDWTDASMGAAGASALLLVVVGVSAAGLRSRRATALSS